MKSWIDYIPYKKFIGILFMIIGIVGFLMFFLVSTNGASNWQYKLDDYLFSARLTTSRMSEIQSVSGDSIAEAFYQQTGYYLYDDSQMQYTIGYSVIATFKNTCFMLTLLNLFVIVFGMAVYGAGGGKFPAFKKKAEQVPVPTAPLNQA
ncbi:hypothetical protein [Hydrogenoanaerobacterium sp.]|uniref:hypothetical protein n=1 Tax=Hydrogenoanaerobacterium sp. TaxID=2953763 RepID=UPI002896BB90|nr:hypothetical protein [Hydrogenoanaerobacterium sp.]